MHSARMMMAAAPVMLAAGTAAASAHQWEWSPGDPGVYAVSNRGGTIAHIDATYDTLGQRLTWEVEFADQITRGFTLVLSDGPNPKGHPGQLAILYVDATDLNNFVVTAYAYNGENSADSFKDGNGTKRGAQRADLIHGAGDTGWIASAGVQGAGDGRLFALDLVVSAINAHSPRHPGPDAWEGMAFGEEIGVWMHPYASLRTDYTRRGKLRKWRGAEGWFDGGGFETAPVPTPGPVALGAIALAVGFVRRRGRGA